MVLPVRDMAGCERPVCSFNIGFFGIDHGKQILMLGFPSGFTIRHHNLYWKLHCPLVSAVCCGKSWVKWDDRNFFHSFIFELFINCEVASKAKSVHKGNCKFSMVFLKLSVHIWSTRSNQLCELAETATTKLGSMWLSGENVPCKQWSRAALSCGMNHQTGVWMVVLLDQKSRVPLHLFKHPLELPLHHQQD